MMSITNTNKSYKKVKRAKRTFKTTSFKTSRITAFIPIIQALAKARTGEEPIKCNELLTLVSKKMDMALFLMKWAMKLAEKAAAYADEENCRKLLGLRVGLINTNLDLGRAIITHSQRMKKIMTPINDLEEENIEKRIRDCQSSAKYIMREAEIDIKAKVDLIKEAFSEDLASDSHMWAYLQG